METKVVFDEKETKVKMTLAHCDGCFYKEQEYYGMPIKLGQWFGQANCYGHMHVPIVIRGYEHGGLLRVHTYTKGSWQGQWVDMKYVEVEVMNYLNLQAVCLQKSVSSLKIMLTGLWKMILIPRELTLSGN